ncbi:hypothetical protein Taro_035586 [Colocasia esculenta]|uniref:Uncharacterized protein n=1 Tax=Colocasia esculenta TaxID=4460 RepID=A0A843WJ28_COLES|nr:hypothetical protein [Colocasia esculenta]
MRGRRLECGHAGGEMFFAFFGLVRRVPQVLCEAGTLCSGRVPCVVDWLADASPVTLHGWVAYEACSLGDQLL